MLLAMNFSVYPYIKDIIIEFKAADFQPVNCTFNTIYHGGSLFGPEVTFRIFRDLYGFASVDYFTKNGCSIGLNSPTHVDFMPLGIGLKYLACVSEHASLYVGIGFTPTLLQTKNCSPYVVQKTSRWGFGGIAKFGAFIDLSHNFLLDLFIDYSFVNVKSTCAQSATGYVQPHTAHLSGAIFGVGLGYTFDCYC
jgi:hypothetical protein